MLYKHWAKSVLFRSIFRIQNVIERLNSSGYMNLIFITSCFSSANVKLIASMIHFRYHKFSRIKNRIRIKKDSWNKKIREISSIYSYPITYQ